MSKLICLASLLASASLAQGGDSFLNHRIPLQQARRWQHIDIRPRPNTLIAQNEPSSEPNRCAHMLTFVPGQEIDAKIHLGSGSGNQDAKHVMPQKQGMPTCAADVKTLGSAKKPTASEAPADGEFARD